MSIPWLVIGDFNQVTCVSEKKGGRPVLQSRINSFLHMVRTCGLVDLGFTGPKYTWTNIRQGLANVQERLDWAFGNTLGVEKFKTYRVVHLPRSRSDHLLLMVHDPPAIHGAQLGNPLRFSQHGSSIMVLNR